MVPFDMKSKYRLAFGLHVVLCTSCEVFICLWNRTAICRYLAM